MDRMARRSEYFARFMDKIEAGPLRTFRQARLYMEAEFTPAEAAQWIGQGFTAQQAEKLASLGVTPEQARAIWDAADTIEGISPDKLSREELAQRIKILNE